MKVFISPPMRDKTNEQIKAERERAVKAIKEKFPGDEIEIMDSFFENAPHDAKPLWFLGKSIQLLSGADLAYFIGEWRNYRGCKAENYLAKEYGINTMEE